MSKAKGIDDLLEVLRNPPDWEKAKIKTTNLAQVKLRKVEWLWLGRLPLGAISLLEGDPDKGKTTLAIELCVRVALGIVPYDGSELVLANNPRDVVFQTAEDDLAATIRPRAEAVLDVLAPELKTAARAKVLARIHTTSIKTGGVDQLLSLPTDLPKLEEVIERYHAALLVIDPVFGFLGSETNSHQDHAVRRALAPIAAMSLRQKVATLGIRHLRKSPGTKAMYQGGGSIGLIAAARSSLLAALDPSDPATFVLASTKCNLARKPESLRYRIVEAPKWKVGRIDWVGTCDHTADDLISGPVHKSTSEIEKAKEWLRTRLAGKRVRQKRVLADAEEQEISQRTLVRAKDELQVKSERDNGRWWWRLPAKEAE
ncbi:MAG: AAA family ATPase [Deltaproteobacteria bacterium]